MYKNCKNVLICRLCMVVPSIFMPQKYFSTSNLNSGHSPVDLPSTNEEQKKCWLVCSIHFCFTHWLQSWHHRLGPTAAVSRHSTRILFTLFCLSFSYSHTYINFIFLQNRLNHQNTAVSVFSIPFHQHDPHYLFVCSAL